MRQTEQTVYYAIVTNHVFGHDTKMVSLIDTRDLVIKGQGVKLVKANDARCSIYSADDDDRAIRRTLYSDAHVWLEDAKSLGLYDKAMQIIKDEAEWMRAGAAYYDKLLAQHGQGG